MVVLLNLDAGRDEGAPEGVELPLQPAGVGRAAPVLRGVGTLCQAGVLRHVGKAPAHSPQAGRDLGHRWMAQRVLRGRIRRLLVRRWYGPGFPGSLQHRGPFPRHGRSDYAELTGIPPLAQNVSHC